MKTYQAIIKRLRDGALEVFTFESESDHMAKQLVHLLYGIHSHVWEVQSLDEVVRKTSGKVDIEIEIPWYAVN